MKTTIQRAHDEIQAMTNAAGRLLAIWQAMPENEDAKLCAGYPVAFPAFEEVFSALVAWRESVGDTLNA